MSVDLAPTVVASWNKLAGESSVCVCVITGRLCLPADYVISLLPAGFNVTIYTK